MPAVLGALGQQHTGDPIPAAAEDATRDEQQLLKESASSV